MRIVTLVAVFSNRFMDVLHAEFVLAILMALKTKFSLVRRSNQQFLVFTGVGAMTGYTISRSHGAMPVGFGKNRGLVAVETQAADTGTIPAQLKTHRGFMGVMTVDTPFLYRLMDNAVTELMLLGLMTDQTEILAGSLHGLGIKGAVRAVAGDTDPGAHRPMHMGGFAHIGVAFRGTIGPGRRNLFKIVLAPAQLVALLAVQSHGIAVDIKTLVALGSCLLRRTTKNLHLLLELVGAQTDDILPLPEGNHDPEGAPVHRHDAAGRLAAHAIDGNPLDLGAVDEAGQKKFPGGDPGTIERSNHGYFRGPGRRGDHKSTKTGGEI